MTLEILMKVLVSVLVISMPIAMATTLMGAVRVAITAWAATLLSLVSATICLIWLH